MLYEKETGLIIKACLNVHNEMGCGFLEAVYQSALAYEFRLLGIPYEKEAQVPVVYKGQLLDRVYYPDFICYDKIIVELKAASSLVKAHKAQVLNYLAATGNQIGILVNFGQNSLKYERISSLHDLGGTQPTEILQKPLNTTYK